MSTPQPDLHAGAPQAPLSVRGATRERGGRRVLDGVDLDVAAGTLVALLGPNGAGKTSLVRAICGRLRLDAGTVRLKGGDPFERPQVRQALGLVPQELALYPDLTAHENLEVFAALSGVPRAERRARIASTLAWVELSDRAGSRARALSGGLQRRLNLAAAVLHRPAVLLLDEPTVGVDPAARERLHALLRELKSQGTAVLLTTHDLDQAAELADRVVILVDGRVRAAGSLPELIAQQLGDQRELTAVFRSAPGDEARRRLLELGLAASSDTRLYRGRVAAGAPTDALIARVRAFGLQLEELRLLEPGLRAVYFRVAGRELDS